MSQSLRSMSPAQRKAAIARRLKAGGQGMGYWAAVNAQKYEEVEHGNNEPQNQTEQTPPVEDPQAKQF